MHDETCVRFLQWALPRLNLRWSGFRKVRGQVCKRLARRLQALELRSLDAYRAYLEAHPEEWTELDRMCRITISRFYRDRGVFDTITENILPDLARRAQQHDRPAVHAWSAGCAGGEEVYTLRIAWEEAVQPSFLDIGFSITATDISAHMLQRAARGCYQPGSLKELPSEWQDRAFASTADGLCVRPLYRTHITWLRQDIREAMPGGPFDLILCRNLAFMYFDATLQRQCLEQFQKRMQPGGYLILGKHETLPDDAPGFTPYDAHQRIYQRSKGEGRRSGD